MNTPARIAVAGMVALAVAMGIGRFAFTPLLPMMLADGVVTLRGASWLASANYLGYLVGALLCTFQPLLWRLLRLQSVVNGPALLKLGLGATVVLTAGMALHLPAAWPLLRFVSGVASALVFVYGSGFCLGQLARLGHPSMGALIYTGPGAGIVLSGLAATVMVQLHWSAAAGWLIFGVLAAVLTAAVWQVFDPGRQAPAAAATTATAASTDSAVHSPTEIGMLTFAYGLAGFGYIITATFLPVIARQALPGSPWLDMFWPIFGLGVIGGALVASRVPAAGDMRARLAICYVIQAAGVAASLVSPSLAGFAVGSLLLGLPFTAITFFAMQEVRRVRPAQAASYMGLLTALYGLGQIVGPPLAAVTLAHSATPKDGFTLALEIAAAALAVGAVAFWAMTRMYPMQHRPLSKK